MVTKDMATTQIEEIYTPRLQPWAGGACDLCEGNAYGTGRKRKS